jgi:hypothetical protein
MGHALIFGLIGCAALGAHAAVIVRRTWETLAVLACVDVVVALFVATAATRPAVFAGWMQEDAWVEWATFAAFLLAAVASLSLFGRGRRDGHRWPLVAIGRAGLALFCVFVAGEEISWGQRLFGIEPPEVFLAENYQQELNLHNFLKDRELLSIKLDSRHLVALIAVAYGFVAPVLSRLRLLRGLPSPSIVLLPWFGAVALCEVTYPVALGGEACELVLGLLFLADAVLAIERGRALAPTRKSLLLLSPALACGLGAVVPPTSDLLQQADPDQVLLARLELTRLCETLEAAAGSPGAEDRGARFHKRLYTAVRNGYVSLPEPHGAELAQRYFLDPWKNPYWLHVSGDRAILYSFGPNGRRDTDWSRSSGDGDDLGEPVHLRPDSMASVRWSGTQPLSGEDRNDSRHYIPVTGNDWPRVHRRAGL